MPTTVIFSGSSVDLANTANYSGGALPSAGDTLIIRQRTASITTNLSALAGIALAALIVEASFTGSIGSGNTHAEIDAAVVVWAGQGSQALLDFAAHTIASVTIQTTGTGASDGLEAVRIKGSDIGAVYVLGGSVCIAGHQPTDTADVTTLVIGSTSAASPPVCRVGVGTTVADIDVYNGTLANDGASPSGAVRLMADSAVYNAGGSADHTGTVQVTRGTYYDRTDGTITALTLDGGTYDASQDPRPKTLTNATLSAGVFNQLNNITYTNPPVLSGFSLTLS